MSALPRFACFLVASIAEGFALSSWPRPRLRELKTHNKKTSDLRLLSDYGFMHTRVRRR